MNTRRHRLTDVVVLSFVGVMLLALLGVFVNSPPILFLSIPVLTTLLLTLATSDLVRTEGTRRAWVGVHAFNLVFFALWLTTLIGLGTEATFGGLPLSTGVIVYLIWPYCTIAGSLLYAYVCKVTDIARVLDDAETR